MSRRHVVQGECIWLYGYFNTKHIEWDVMEVLGEACGGGLVGVWWYLGRNGCEIWQKRP